MLCSSFVRNGKPMHRRATLQGFSAKGAGDVIVFLLYIAVSLPSPLPERIPMVGLQILKRTRQVSAQLVKAFTGLPVANISDCMTRMTAGGPPLRPMHKSGYLAGPAL